MSDYFTGLSQQIFSGLIVVAIVALITARPLIRWLKRKRIPEGPKNKITVLVAKLEGDLTDTTHHTIRESIAKHLGESIAVIVLDEGIILDAGRHETTEATAQRRAHDLLKNKNADLLIWGRLKSPSVVSLRFTPAEQQYTQPQTYTLTQESLELPTDFISHLGIAIAAYATSALDNTKILKPKMVTSLKTLGDRLDTLLENASTTFDLATVATLYHSCARVKVRRYYLAGDDQDLRQSITLNRQALERRDRTRYPDEWAKSQNNLGSCLGQLGERTAVLSYFDEAESALQAALDEHKRQDDSSVLTVSTQMNLANVLLKRGQRENKDVNLKRAIRILDEISTEALRANDPQLFAGIQNNRGIALMALGARETNLDNVYRALEVLGEALEIRTQEVAPFDWACTMVNMAASLVDLGQRTGELGNFQSAISHLTDALSVIKRAQNPRIWAMAKANLGIAQIVVSHQQDELVLRNAIASLSGALEITKQKDDPVLWSTVQMNLGRAQTQLGALTNDFGLLKQALLPLRAVISEPSVQSSLLAKSQAANEYGVALLNLGDRDNPSVTDEALRLFQGLADDLSTVPSAHQIWRRAMINLGRAERLKGEHNDDLALINKSISTLSHCLGTVSLDRDRVPWSYIHFQLAKSFLALAERGAISDNLDECKKHCGEALTILRNEPGNLLVGEVNDILARAEAIEATE